MTLAESLLSLTVAGIMAGFAVPPARRAIDAMQVRAARETLFGLLTRTRATAIAQGGASLVLDLTGNTAAVTTMMGVVVTQSSLAEFDVAVTTDASASTIVLTYDARGIGRMASRTLRLVRGEATAGITVSSYGRVRRW